MMSGGKSEVNHYRRHRLPNHFDLLPYISYTLAYTAVLCGRGISIFEEKGGHRTVCVDFRMLWSVYDEIDRGMNVDIPTMSHRQLSSYLHGCLR
jgi:hypothetical protein